MAVVTGGAGSMGTIICGALAREGMRVVVGYNRSAEKAKALAASLPGADTRRSPRLLRTARRWPRLPRKLRAATASAMSS